MVHSRSALYSLVALSVLACTKKPSESESLPNPPAAASAALAAVPSTAPMASASVAPEPPKVPDVPPVCQIESKKVWTKGVSRLTGLTEATLPDGRAAIGFVVGTQPQILLVGSSAKGSMVKVPIAKTSRLASVPKGAQRAILRVTPVKVDGDSVKAFVDFEDIYKDKKKSIVCGPADANENWVEFEGIPYSARKGAKPEEIAALFRQEGAAKVYDEVHTCRTFTNLERGESWVLGSDLHGELKADNSIDWRSDFVVLTDNKTKKRTIESTAITNKTLDDEHYDVPVSFALKNGSYVVAARHHGQFIAGILGADKSLTGQMSRYPGYATLPDIAMDGDESLVISTSLAKAKGEFGLRALRIDLAKPEFPKKLHVVVTDKSGTDAPSESDPDFLRDAKGQRWVAHIEGARGDGKLSLAPINKDFVAVGRSFSVTEEGEKASAARLIPLKDKGILVVFLREADKTLELVTEEVHCKVEQ